MEQRSHANKSNSHVRTNVVSILRPGRVFADLTCTTGVDLHLRLLSVREISDIMLTQTHLAEPEPGSSEIKIAIQ
jgi:hypothetical protein